MVQMSARPESLMIKLPKIIELFVTQEQLEILAAANRDLRIERTAKGELIVNPPTGWETGNRNGIINQQLFNWTDVDGTGIAFDSSTGFTLPNGAIRSPDASWISKERWQGLTSEQLTTFPQICPDFVVELCSDTIKSLQEKMIEYRENGAKLGWLIIPQKRQVEIYEPGIEVEKLDNPMELSGVEILPGFVLNLRQVWG